MKNDFVEKIDTILGDIDNVSMDKLEELTHETLKFFDYLQTALSSSDEEKKKEALEIAQVVQDKLQKQADKSLSKSGLKKEELASFLQEQKNFTNKDWESFQNVQKEIQDFQKHVATNH